MPCMVRLAPGSSSVLELIYLRSTHTNEEQEMRRETRRENGDRTDCVASTEDTSGTEFEAKARTLTR